MKESDMIRIVFLKKLPHGGESLDIGKMFSRLLV